MSLRNELLEIRNEHGYLTPELLVTVARSEDHPLHSRVFNKPASEAAEAYYLSQAHELIRSCRVVYKPATETESEASVRAFHAVRGEEDGYVYEPAETVVDDPVLRAIVLRDMEREWKQLHRRYAAFSEFADLVARDLAQEAA